MNEQQIQQNNSLPNWEQELNGLFTKKEKANKDTDRFDWQELLNELDELKDLDVVFWLVVIINHLRHKYVIALLGCFYL